MSLIRKILYDPRVRDVDVDDNDLLILHRQILLDKPMMRHVFEDFYDEMINCRDQYLCKSGSEIELGSGAGFFKSILPSLITSDIRKGEHIDCVLDAQDMSLEDNSVRCIYAINVFHHIPSPQLFFSELIRVCKTGGGCILIEPHSGPVSSFIHSKIHKDEYFNKTEEGWNNVNINGPLSGANQALAHNIFERDKEQFKKLYGESLEIVEIKPLTNGLRYILSGGVNFRQLAPSFIEPLLRIIEWGLSPLSNWLSLHQIIVIRVK